MKHHNIPNLNVFPLPVWPYAKMVPLYPFMACLMMGAAKSLRDDGEEKGWVTAVTKCATAVDARVDFLLSRSSRGVRVVKGV